MVRRGLRGGRIVGILFDRSGLLVGDIVALLGGTVVCRDLRVLGAVVGRGRLLFRGSFVVIGLAGVVVGVVGCGLLDVRGSVRVSGLAGVVCGLLDLRGSVLVSGLAGVVVGCGLAAATTTMTMDKESTMITRPIGLRRTTNNEASEHPDDDVDSEIDPHV